MDIMATQIHATKRMNGMFGANSITGMDVYDMQGQKLGSLHDSLINEASDKLEFVILSFGGQVSGVNQRYYPLPWHLLRFDETRDGYVIDIDSDKLNSAPTCELSDTGVWLGDGSSESVNEYYCTTRP
jgi:sporulation protein YlmC with PRC-barrel domain